MCFDQGGDRLAVRLDETGFGTGWCFQCPPTTPEAAASTECVVSIRVDAHSYLVGDSITICWTSLDPRLHGGMYSFLLFFILSELLLLICLAQYFITSSLWGSLQTKNPSMVLLIEFHTNHIIFFYYILLRRCCGYACLATGIGTFLNNMMVYLDLV